MRWVRRLVPLVMLLGLLVVPPEAPARSSVWESLGETMRSQGVDAPATADVNRFVAVWSPRVRDEAFVEAWLRRPGLPPEVEAEGFHARHDLQRMFLVERLYASIVRADPAVRAELGRLPAAERLRAMDDERRLLHTLIFHKESLAELRDRLQGAERPSEPAATEARETTSEPLRTAVEELKVVPELEMPDAGPSPALAAPRTAEIPAPARLALPDVAQAGDPETVPVVGGYSADYRVCYQSAQVQHTCTAQVPTGIAVSIDVTGDGTPDLDAYLRPGVSGANLLGLTTEFGVVRHEPVLGRLPAHVYGVFEVGDERYAIGFDGRADTLARVSIARATVRDLLRFAAGNALDLSLELYHDPRYPYPAEEDVTFAKRTLIGMSGTPAETDPVDGALHLEPVPESSWTNLTVDFASRAAVWSASHEVAGAWVDATIGLEGRTWRAHAELARIPQQVDVRFGNGDVRFHGITGPLGSALVQITNHGTVTTFDGNHASVVYRSDTGDLDASVRVEGLRLVEYRRTGGGFAGALEMDGGGYFRVNADVSDGTQAVRARADVFGLPDRISLSQSRDVLTYSGSDNFEIRADLEAGNTAALNAAPTPPIVHGFGVRDGFGCVGADCGLGFKLSVWLTGLPTEVTVDAASRSVRVVNFRPDADKAFLALDVQLAHAVSPPIALAAVQSGIPAGIEFTFGPADTITHPDGSRETKFRYQASAPLGALEVHLHRGPTAAAFVVSNIPTYADVSVVFGNGRSAATGTFSQPINEITAVLRRSAASVVEAAVVLRQIPTSVSVSFGRTALASGGDSFTLPGLTYRANGDTLDVVAFVEATLFGGDVRARAQLYVEDLGRSSSAAFSGGVLRVTSAPATRTLEIHVWAEIDVYRSFEVSVGGSSVSLVVRGHAGLLPLTIEDLALRVTGLRELRITPGIVTAIEGDYETVGITLGGLRAELEFELSGEIDTRWGDIPLFSISLHLSRSLDVAVHYYTNHLAKWIDTDWPVCDLEFSLRPHPHGESTNRFGPFGPPGASEGNAWLITPDPDDLVPDFLVDVATYWRSPLGGEFRYECD